MNAPERRWDPFAELQSLRAELSRLVGAGFSGARGVLNNVDLDRSDDAFTVTARLPGVAPEEVVLDVDVRELIIRACTDSEADDVRSARSRRFEHRVALPADIDPDRAEAVMDHGLLTVTLPRVVRAGRRTITVGSARRPQPGDAGSKPTPHDPIADREMHSPDATP